MTVGGGEDRGGRAADGSEDWLAVVLDQGRRIEDTGCQGSTIPACAITVPKPLPIDPLAVIARARAGSPSC